MLKIVFLDQSGQLGGAELMLLELIPKLSVEARVILLEPGRFEAALREQDIEVKVIELKGELKKEVTKQAGLLTLLSAVPALLKVVQRLRESLIGVDLLYANTPKAWLLGGLAAIATRTPMVLHLHDILSRSHFSRINLWLMVQCANRISVAVIANSKAAADAFERAGGMPQLVTVVPNGFDLRTFVRPVVGNRTPIRVTLNLADEPLIAMAGRLTRWKGQHVFIEALAKLPGVHGLVIGDALFTDDDRLYAESLPKLASQLGCSNRVHFLGFRDDVREIFREANVVVHCSVVAEPFGRVIVEAMLCGRPVVAVNEGGPAEIIEQGKTGLLFPNGDAGVLAEMITRLLSDPALAELIAENGRRAASKNFDLDNVAEQTKALLVKACHKN